MLKYIQSLIIDPNVSNYIDKAVNWLSFSSSSQRLAQNWIFEIIISCCGAQHNIAFSGFLKNVDMFTIVSNIYM